MDYRTPVSRPAAGLLATLLFAVLAPPAAHGSISNEVRREWARDFEAHSLARVYSSRLSPYPMPYRLFVPPGYDPKKQYPLILFLHGAGGAYDIRTHEGFNTKQVEDGPHFLIFATPGVQAEHPCFILAPQAPRSARGNLKWVDTPWSKGSYRLNRVPISPRLAMAMQILAQVRKEYSIDADRLYVTGFSMGGYSTWDAVLRYPHLFAAAIPIAGAGDPTHARAIAGLPVWAFHGDADPVVPARGSREMIAAIRAAGGHPIYTEYRHTGHSAWGSAYTDPDLVPWDTGPPGGSWTAPGQDDLIPWLFAQSRSGRSEPPSAPPAVKAVPVSASRIGLSWLAPRSGPPVWYYAVYRNGAFLTAWKGTEYTDSGLSAGTFYTYRVAAVTYRGGSALGPPVIGTTYAQEQPASTSAASWRLTAFSAAPRRTTVGMRGNAWTISCGAGGAPRGDNASLVSTTVEGDGAISAQVVSQSARKATVGVQLRESLEPSAREVSLSVSPAAGLFLSFRDYPGAPVEREEMLRAASVPLLPLFLKLERSGHFVYAFESRDGLNWGDPIAAHELPLETRLEAGAFVTPGPRDPACTVRLADVSLQFAESSHPAPPSTVARRASGPGSE